MQNFRAYDASILLNVYILLFLAPLTQNPVGAPGSSVKPPIFQRVYYKLQNYGLSFTSESCLIHYLI